jgi:hypothetical protein
MAKKEKNEASAVAEIEVPTPEMVGLGAKDLRKLKIQGFTQDAAAMNIALHNVGMGSAGFRIVQAANRLANAKREVHSQACLRQQGNPDRLDFAIAEHKRLAAELAALEQAARDLYGPLRDKLRSAYTLIKSVREYAAECRREDGEDIDEVLVDSETQYQLTALASLIKDWTEIQERQWVMIQSELPEKK